MDTLTISRMLKKTNGTKVGNGLYYSRNHEFYHFYSGNRMVVGNFDKNIICAPNEEKEANARFKTIVKLFSNYAKEKGVSGLLFDKNIPVVLAYIDKKWIVVDGQNRLVVCKTYGIPYYFRILEDIETEEELLSYIKRLNFVKTNWTKNQQIGSEARLGNKYAQFIIDASIKYDVPLTNIVYFTLGKDKHKIKTDFKVTPFDTNKALLILETIKHVSDRISKTKTNAKDLRTHNRFTNFITKVVEKGQVEKLLAIAETKRMTRIKGASNLEAYSQAFGMYDILND